MAVATPWEKDPGEPWKTLGVRALVFERAAAALERSAVLAEQHAAHYERLGHLELAQLERVAGARARRAAQRARCAAAEVSDLNVRG